MDTILYFYQKRGLTAPYVEPVGLKKYMLIRIGLDVRQETWFGVGLTGECPGAGADRPEPFRGKGFSAAVENGGKKALTEAAAAGGRIRRRKIWQLWNLPGHLAGGESGKFFTRKRRHGTRQGKEREAPEEGQEKIRRVRDIMGKLAAEAAELAGEGSRIWYVYEDSVRKCLTEKGESPSGEENPAQRQRKLLPSLWEQYFEQKEFADYCGLFWAEQLLEKALLPHFVVLGTADCIFEILERKAERRHAAQFRKALEKDGFTMMQYSVYVRHCASKENMAVHLNRVRKSMPPSGYTSILSVTDKQYGEIRNFWGHVEQKRAGMPQQLEFF